MQYLTAVLLLVLPAAGAAQSLCFRGQPRPACRTFLLTESGGNLLVSPQSLFRTHKAQLEVGVMRNRGLRSALGATVFAETNLDDETYIGVKPRYRRWLSRNVALDMSAGPRYDTQFGSLGGVVQAGVSFGDWISFTTQLELGPNRLTQTRGATMQIGARFGSYLGALGIVAAPIGLALKSFKESMTF